MNKEIKILYLEDIPEDAELVAEALDRGGLVFRSRRVDNEVDYLFQLRHNRPDVILSDHGLPTFSGYEALSIAKDKYPDVPFIFVTGSPGADVAIETFESGATDYVLKDRLENLAPAVRRALRAAEEKRLRKLLEEDREILLHELHDALARVKTLAGILHICPGCKQCRDDLDHWHPLERFLQDRLNVTISHALCPSCTSGPNS